MPGQKGAMASALPPHLDSALGSLLCVPWEKGAVPWFLALPGISNFTWEAAHAACSKQQEVKEGNGVLEAGQGEVGIHSHCTKRKATKGLYALTVLC